MPVNTSKLAAESGCHNPGPLVWLISHAKETTIVVEGVELMALVETGSQIPVLTEGFCRDNGVEDPSTEEFDKGCIACQGYGGVSIQYEGYVKANLTIPDLPQHNEDVLF